MAVTFPRLAPHTDIVLVISNYHSAQGRHCFLVNFCTSLTCFLLSAIFSFFSILNTISYIHACSTEGGFVCNLVGLGKMMKNTDFDKWNHL